MSGVVIPTIKSGTTEVQDLYELHYIEIVREVNRIPYARIEFLEGDPALQELDISDKDHFELGRKIEIRLRYEGAPKSAVFAFKGIVVKHSLEVGQTESLFVVELKDEAIKMTMGRKSRVFEKKADNEIIQALIEANGLDKGNLVNTGYKHEEMVQYYCTDWDFMLNRADVNGQLATIENGKVSLIKINQGSGKTIKLEYPLDDIYNLEMEADASHQFEAVEAVSWDVKTNKLTKALKGKNFALKLGSHKPPEVARSVGGKLEAMQSGILAKPKEMQNWADAGMAKSRMSMLCGRVQVPGLPKVKPGQSLQVKGVGKRFNGKTMITGVKHTVSVNGWDTDLQFGLSARWFAQEEDVVAPPAAGLLPGIHGLQVGIVDKFEKDKENQFRVKVSVPAFDEKKGMVWARLAALDAGNKRGFFFRPEPGDEVVLGFLNDDPRQAVILGGLYSSKKNTPPKGLEKLSKDNILKGIVTRNGISLLFNDKDKEQALTLKTSEKTSIVLDEKAKQIKITDLNGNHITMNDKAIVIEDKVKKIVIKDGNGNQIIMDNKGIKLKSGKDLILEAGGNKVTLASGGLQLKAKSFKVNSSGAVEIKGSKIDLK